MSFFRHSHSHKMNQLALSGLSTDQNDRFLYPLIYFNKWNPYPFIYLNPEISTPFGRSLPPRIDHYREYSSLFTPPGQGNNSRCKQMVALKPNLYLRSRSKVSHRVEISKRVQTYSLVLLRAACVLFCVEWFSVAKSMIQYFSFDTLVTFNTWTIMYTNIYRRLNVTNINRRIINDKQQQTNHFQKVYWTVKYSTWKFHSTFLSTSFAWTGLSWKNIK